MRKNAFTDMTTDEVLAYALDVKNKSEHFATLMRAASDELAARVQNETGQHTVPGVGSFTVSENNTYAEDAIAKVLSPGQIRRCTKSVLDKAVVKRLYPDAYNGAKVPRGVKVTLRHG